jgi:hypothetical protein
MATAADLSLLYDRSTLEYWGERYKRSTNKILDEVWRVLLSKEKHDLGGRPALNFPLYAEGEARQQPLQFYSSRNIVVFPVFSLKFLDDLCTAYAWLQVKGYRLETVSEYTAILFYGKPPSDGFPPPLKALGIPKDALNDHQVDELALGHFVTARTFILLHEMGHILFGHNARAPRTLDESVRNEQEADRFAATVMQRTPLPPLGMLVWFLADAHWTGFPPRRGDHPMSGERVQALADHIDDPSLAEQLRKLGQFFDDPDIRAGFVTTGRAGDLAALTLRRPGELPRRRAKSTPEALFEGVYRGEFVQFGEEPGPMAIELILERRGDHVTGQYNFGLGFGTIEGDMEGRRLYFDWKWVNNFGKGILEGRGDGSFIGTWGYREAMSGAGTWTGRRSP